MGLSRWKEFHLLEQMDQNWIQSGESIQLNHFPSLSDFSIEPENQQKKKHYFCSTNTGDDNDNDTIIVLEIMIMMTFNNIGQMMMVVTMISTLQYPVPLLSGC